MLIEILLSIIVIIQILIVILLYKRNNPGQTNDLKNLEDSSKEIKTILEVSFKNLKKDISSNRIETSRNITETMKNINSIIPKNLNQISNIFKHSLQKQREQLKMLSDNLNTLTKTIDNKLKDIMNTKEKKLEEKRQTVDEKLQKTLEKRLTELFKTVSTQLENVCKSPVEMKTITEDVGDLKRVLTNVKQRGVFGELQLEKILENILPHQYTKNAKIRNNTIELAIKIPSKSENGKFIYLPIDSKYPREDYERILNAQDKAVANMLLQASKSLSNTIKKEAKDISEKYIDPPKITDFAVLFLPTESLFAEVLRIPGLFEEIRREYKVIITGPTTITAILNSLQMGFRTLAIEKKSNEVWKILGAGKNEFNKFSEYLRKTKEKLEEAAKNIENAQKRTNIIDKKLKNVKVIDVKKSERILPES